MDQNQNNNLFDDDDNPIPERPSEPTQMGGGARVYQTPPGVVPNEPMPYNPPPMGQSPVQPAKKSNTPLIIGIVVALLLLCCCCLAAVGYWAYINGDTLLEDFSLVPMLIQLI